MKAGEFRLIPAGTKIWSIKNQTTLITEKDEIVEIKHTTFMNDVVFVELKQLLFNLPGHIPTLIGKGTDEWELSYKNTKHYEVPAPNFYL